MKLTATEQRVVELYASGLRPREIANKLGISVNTVYKALSKHRKLTEPSAPVEDQTPQQIHNYYAVVLPTPSMSVLYSFAPPQIPQADLLPLLKRLEDALSKLERLLEGKQVVERPTAVAETVPSGEVPEFLKRNAWVKLLRGRSSA